MGLPESEEERLLAFLYAAPVGLVEIGMGGEIAMINPYAMKHLLPIAGGRGAGNLFTILESCAPELRNMLDGYGKDRGTVCEGHRVMVDIGRSLADGDPKVLACTLVKLDPARAIACLSDISLQVSQERRLKQAEAWFSSLLNDVNDYAVLSVAASGQVDAANPSWEKQTGFDCQAIIGQHLDVLFPTSGADGKLTMGQQLRIAARDGWHLEESWHQRRDGSKYWCQRLLAARSGNDGGLTGYTLVLRDVRRQHHDTDDLRRLLTRDHLTGAANRAHFQQMLEREQHGWRESGTPLSLIMVDIDHFKRVNDAHGHLVGDMVLRRFADTIAEALRPTDVLARLGGEEFAILLPDTDLLATVRVAETLRASIANAPIEVPDGQLSVTASFGCATIAEGVDLLGAADAALYRAKRTGRDRVCAHNQSAAAA